MNNNHIHAEDIINCWQAKGLIIDAQHGSITRQGKLTKLEPLVMDLLQLLLTQPNQVVSKSTIMDTLWAGKYVNDEALTKLVSKLRKALGDNPRNPEYIKTVPKKGYSLLFDQAAVARCEPDKQKPRLALVISSLVALTTATFLLHRAENKPQPSSIELMYDRAESNYYQYSRLENESALKLYEKIMAADPNHALSQSGLANALVQKTLRWPNAINEPEVKHTSLTASISAGRLDNQQALLQLNRAEGLALRATVLAPDNAKAHRSLGLVYAAQQKFDLALKQYQKAIALDPDEWGALINLSEIQAHSGQQVAALDSLKQAHAAMTKVYQTEEVMVRPWYPKLGVVIAEKNVELGRFSEAEIWYRQVLEFEPYNEPATTGLMQILKQQGDTEAAEGLCFELQQKVNPSAKC